MGISSGMRPSLDCRSRSSGSGRSAGGFHPACDTRGQLSRRRLPAASSSTREASGRGCGVTCSLGVTRTVAMAASPSLMKTGSLLVAGLAAVLVLHLVVAHLLVIHLLVIHLIGPHLVG